MGRQFGRYETLRPIAKGGMATVYLARVVGEGGFEREVALKLMHPHLAEDPEFVGMFLDEARLAARIRHANVVSVLEVGRESGELFLVMELVDGHALQAIMRHLARLRRSMPLPHITRIVVDLLEGLHAAHELRGPDGQSLQLVHRDVSPHNVLVGLDGVARITDFGVARAQSRLSSTRGATLKGKLSYLSPEQIRGEVDRRSDVFAAGIVAWELLTQKRLFRGENEGQTIAQVLAGARRSPRDVNPDVPEAVSEIVMRALAQDPAARFQTAGEFADALSSATQASSPRGLAEYLSGLDVPTPKVEASVGDGHSSQSQATSGPFPPLTGNTGTEARPLVSSMGPNAPRRRWAWLLVAVVPVLAAVAFFVTRRAPDATPAATPRASATIAAPTPSAHVPTTPEPAPSASAMGSAAPEPPATAEASATAEPSAAPPTTTTAPARPASPRGDRPAKPSATSYRPEEL